MNLKTLHYNNNLLYLAAIENNIDMVNNLFSRGYPKSLKDTSAKLKQASSNEDVNKVVTSYHNATVNLIKNLVKHQHHFQMLTHCLYHLVKNEKFKWIHREHQSICSQAFYYGNTKAFDLLCDVFGKEKLCESKALLWYIHQARRNKLLSKKAKEDLCLYIESLGIDWSQADMCLVRWAKMNRNLEDFQYFYQKRKEGLKSVGANTNTLRKELSKCIESFLSWSIDVENNLKNPLLNHIATRKEFTKINPYEGYWVILRKSYKLSNYFEVDTLAMEDFFQNLLNDHPDLIKHTSKSKIKIPQLNNMIEKINLKEKLSQKLAISTQIRVVNKI